MAMYYNGKKVRNLYYNGKCITRLALGKEMTRLVEGDDFVRAEWLVGDGTAYIVNQYNLWSNNVETGSAKINLQKTENNDLVYTDANGVVWAIQQNPTLVPQLMVNFREEGAGVHILEVNPTPETFELEFYKKNGYAVCLFDGIEHQGGTMTESKWNKDISPRIYSYKMSYIREVLPDGTYRSNLTPCRLLRPIPATLDANGIARNAGECGMYNLVNGLFYGNVASSGSFTVEPSLVEGVDYERHKWLVAEIPIQTSMQSLPINSANFSFTVIFGQTANITILKGETHEYYVFDDNMQKIRVWGYNGIGIVYGGDVLSNTMIVKSTGAELLVNNITIPQYSYPIKYLTFYSSSNSPNNTTLRVSKIYIDGVERYIPCRLLRPIPATLDANGIARNAGECGMYDSVSGKFYGNVEASGKFTVSDN